MTPEISERAFEDAVECSRLQYGPDACPGDSVAVRETSPPYGESPPGGYRKRRAEAYDRALCLLPRDVVDFVLATQPKEWKRLEQHHGAAVREQFLKRLAAEIDVVLFLNGIPIFTAELKNPPPPASTRSARSCKARPSAS